MRTLRRFLSSSPPRLLGWILATFRRLRRRTWCKYSSPPAETKLTRCSNSGATAVSIAVVRPALIPPVHALSGQAYTSVIYSNVIW
jgi:hypothetical protein